MWTDRGRRLIRLTACIAVVATGVILFLLSSLELENEQSQMRARLSLRSDVSLPPPGVWRATTLGFDGFAADLTWIQALQYFGRQQQASRTPVSLRDFADTIASLDPYFYEVYPWFSATYRGTYFPISVEDIETMNEFLDRGIRRFPNRWRLPYKAGMNYIGYPQNRTTAERLRLNAKVSLILTT